MVHQIRDIRVKDRLRRILSWSISPEERKAVKLINAVIVIEVI